MSRHVAYRLAETGSGWAGALDREQIDWLRSLVRMQIRRRERALTAFTVRPGQSAEEAQAIRDKFARNLDFARTTLASLTVLRRTSLRDTRECAGGYRQARVARHDNANRSSRLPQPARSRTAFDPRTIRRGRALADAEPMLLTNRSDEQ